MGTIDSRGVYIYAENDNASPFSSLLNLGQQSVSDALHALRLETTGTPVANALIPSAPWVAPGAGQWAVPSLVKKNGLVHLTSGMIIRSTVLSATAGTQYQIASVPAALVSSGAWLPSTEVYGVGATFANSAIPVATYVAVLPTGAVVVQFPSALSFGAGGGTNSVRIPTISWVAP